jgi:hypothetical protein
MYIVKWVCAVVLGLAFLLLATANAWAVASYFRSKRHVSAVPVIGGICGSLALVIVPIDGQRVWWWLPLVLDYGCVPMLFSFFVLRIAASIRGER